MQPTFGQVQERTPVRRPTEMMTGTAAPTVKEIPYDYVARFVLNGKKPANRVQDVINISTEGAFVAVAIGYSFIPSRLKLPASFLDKVIAQGAVPNGTPGVNRLINPNTNLEFPVSLVDVMAQTVARLLGFAASANSDDVRKQLILAAQSLAEMQGLHCLLAKICGIDFKYSIIDSGSGRELQNLAIHNIAGLGESSGERPFRPMAKPMLFMPRSTIRIEIEEVSQGPLYENAELFIVLHGYKMLGYGTG